MKRLIGLLVGIIVIVTGFRLIVTVNPWPEQIWLDMVVIILVFSSNYFNMGHIWKTVPAFRKVIPSLGIFWFSAGIYTVLSLSILFCAHAAVFPFNISLYIQLVLLLLLIAGYTSGYLAGVKAAGVGQGENRAFASIDGLRSFFTEEYSSIAVLGQGYPELRKYIERIGEDLKYLCPLDTKAALELDGKILSEMKVLFGVLGNVRAGDGGLPADQIRASADRIGDLIRIRKECRNDFDK